MVPSNRWERLSLQIGREMLESGEGPPLSGSWKKKLDLNTTSHIYPARGSTTSERRVWRWEQPRSENNPLSETSSDSCSWRTLFFFFLIWDTTKEVIIGQNNVVLVNQDGENTPKQGFPTPPPPLFFSPAVVKEREFGILFPSSLPFSRLFFFVVRADFVFHVTKKGKTKTRIVSKELHFLAKAST